MLADELTLIPSVSFLLQLHFGRLMGQGGSKAKDSAASPRHPAGTAATTTTTDKENRKREAKDAKERKKREKQEKRDKAKKDKADKREIKEKVKRGVITPTSHTKPLSTAGSTGAGGGAGAGAKGGAHRPKTKSISSLQRQHIHGSFFSFFFSFLYFLCSI